MLFIYKVNCVYAWLNCIFYYMYHDYVILIPMLVPQLSIARFWSLGITVTVSFLTPIIIRLTDGLTQCQVNFVSGRFSVLKITH